jgi:transcriptional regulator with PAS, ATPase and Fis domain
MGKEEEKKSLKKELQRIRNKLKGVEPYKKIINQFLFPVIYVDVNYRIQLVNHEFTKAFNTGLEEILNYKTEIFFGKEKFNNLVKHHLDTSLKGELVSHICLLKDHEEYEKRMTLEYFPLFSEVAEVQGVLIIFKNIPGNDQNAFSENTDKTEWINILDAFNEILIVTDLNHNIKFMNSHAREAFQKNNTDWRGKKCHEVVHGTNVPPENCRLHWLNSVYSDASKNETLEFEDDKYIIKNTPIHKFDGEVSGILHQIIPKNEKDTSLCFEDVKKPTINQQVNNEFYDFRKRLVQKHPQLTPHNLTHCTLIRMNLSTKEIASYFNVMPTTIQRSRVRLKKKMGLSKKQDLIKYLLYF